MSWVALGVGVGELALTAYGQNQAAKAASKTPPPRDPQAELGQSFAALQSVAPGRYDLEAQYMPRYAALATARDSQVRNAGVADVARLAPEVSSIRRGSSPETYALIDKILASASSGLDADGRLTPAELRDSQQEARAAFSARGMAGGQPAAFAELLNADRYRQARRDAARTFATGAAGLGASTAADPFQYLLNIPTAGYGAEAGAGADPTSGYFADLYNTNLNMGASQANTRANNTAALYGAGVKAVGDIYGGYLAGKN